MIKSTIKTTALLVGFFFFMTITIKEQPIFLHLYEFISPMTTYTQDKVEKLFLKSVSSTQSYSTKIFENSVPKMRDSVKLKLSSGKKLNNEPAERITNEEKEELDQLIKTH